jgi:hypothetical protein
MAVWHGVALAGALLALLCLSCAVTLLIRAGSNRRWERDATTLELLRRLDARLRARPGSRERKRQQVLARTRDQERKQGAEPKQDQEPNQEPKRKPGSEPNQAMEQKRDPEQKRKDNPGLGRDAGIVCVPCPEQIAAELRRLNHMRRQGLATQSDAWLTAVNNAYDRWLCQGCQSLGVTEELRRLDGLDRELERARIEEVLRDKGF